MDSLRGLAASQVLLFHALVIFPFFYNSCAVQTPPPCFLGPVGFCAIHVFWDGLQAVLFFFALSGFVLALPYLDDRSPAYPAFLIKRFFRIYAPYVVVIALSAMMIRLGASRHEIAGGSNSDLLRFAWDHPVNVLEAIRLLLMIGYPINVDGPAWSLSYELRISVVFPLIVLFVRYTGPWLHALAVFSLMAYSFKLSQFGVDPPLVDLAKTFYYAGFFVGGCSLAKYRHSVQALLAKIGDAQKLSLFLAALALYNWKWEYGGSYFGLDPKYNDLFADMATGVGSLLIIALALSWENMGRLLLLPIFRWLGRVSYSLYLTHAISILCALYFLPDSLPLSWRVAIGVLFSLVIAQVSYRLLEVPSMELGRRLTRKLAL